MSKCPAPVKPEKILDYIEPRTDLIVPIANGEPRTLIDVIEEAADTLDGVRIHQMHCLHDRPYINGAFGNNLRHVSYFLSHITRPAYAAGHVDYAPANFSEVPHIMNDMTKEPIVIAAASLPDQHGYFSLGTSADYVASMIGRRRFFLEATPHMPRTHGANVIHHSQILGWCQTERELVAVPRVEPKPVEKTIAALVAEQIPDRATLQVGIGGIANAILAGLHSHKDLGLHTELLHDGVMDLVEAGVITGVAKEHRRNRSVTTFALGTKELYSWLDDNAAVEMLRVDYVNNPREIARLSNFVSVNATLEVDLLGQCASETIGTKYFSGSGGQADFARGAMYSPGGKAFIVLPSTTRDGRSRIVSTLAPGAVVTTLKNTVDHVVTEHGIARLRGKTLAQRAKALIGIAAPEHRDELARSAHERGLLLD
ncbi:acetyl-CoA hydrolase/transferase family protein [Blastococcus sp. Marseille-P5729]|uniref:acetyl-CoA hydrolase/transferase family protein n=1 Tax=Blastococcus sp. Marseille-P5729 TaxID=2086582 RepID=UPI000D10D41D|nr:acetyl-CoA hydrolase/transferase C-terminal domain-containing protein [Blastococcus sp. Marseille-P5729]